MAKDHASSFLAVVEDARTRITECTCVDVRARMEQVGQFHIIDIREESEWQAGHLPGAIHLSKGVIERDIERTIPCPTDEIICYCSGGFRSVLAVDVLQRMGYRNIRSMQGGFHAWTEASLPVA